MKKRNFENTEIAFKIKSNKELHQACWMFRLISYPGLVKFGNFVVTLMSQVGLPVNWFVKPTVYKLFVGGESLEECIPVIEKVGKRNVRSILDYSVEGKEEDEDIDLALAETLSAIEFAGRNKNTPFAVFKPTGFIRSSSLEILSSDEKNIPAEIQAEEYKFRDRVRKMCSRAYQYDLPILIDAEDTFYQNYIDQIVFEMQKEFNKSSAIVFNTYQMYRWDRLAVLGKDYDRAVSENFFLGAKFVRGAYMERERERAKKFGYPDPIQPDKKSTDRDYDLALEFSVEKIDRISIFNGTHNEVSCLWLTELMKKHKLASNDQRVWFSQLYGMSDHISFNLASEGYNVAKYVPYGPIKQVLPYLNRRAEENTSVKGQTGRELGLIIKELKRRKSN